jgi:glycosyltransferase involved in cell wall biosynthesis
MAEVNAPAAARRLRILYAIGPGDVVRSYRHWRGGEQLLSETSQTYSSQFFEFCRRAGHAGYAVSSFGEAARVEDGAMTVENRPKRMMGAGLRFHASQARYALSLVGTALRWRADVVIVDSGTTHWALLALLKPFRVRVIGCLHNVIWPVGYPPRGFVKRAVLRTDAWFWGRVADGVLAVSPECERQVRELAPRFARPAVQYRAQYRAGDFADVPPPPADASPFRVMFAGRVERNKGVLDIVAIAGELERRVPGRVRFHVCGGGPALGEMRVAVRDAGLEAVVELRGKLERPALLAAYGESHLVIVPTRSDFCEGMPMVCAEAVLCGRPALTSRLSNALDVLPGAIVEAQPDEPRSYVDRIVELLAEPARYERARAACAQHHAVFLDSGNGLRAGLERMIASLDGEAPAAAARSSRA